MKEKRNSGDLHEKRKSLRRTQPVRTSGRRPAPLRRLHHALVPKARCATTPALSANNEGEYALSDRRKYPHEEKTPALLILPTLILNPVQQSRVSIFSLLLCFRVAVISAKNHKRQRPKRQSVTAKEEKSQTPKVLTAILT